MSSRQNLVKALAFIEAHSEENISLKTLSDLEGYSIPQFYRLFKQLTGDTVGEYLIRSRIIKAATRLRAGRRGEEASDSDRRKEARRRSEDRSDSGRKPESRRAFEASDAVGERQVSITQLAYQYGFESHDVFTRAFRRVYGVTPSEYRRSKAIIPPLKQTVIRNQSGRIDLQDQFDHREPITRPDQMTFRLRETGCIQVVGIRCRAVAWDENGAIGELWSHFLERVEEIPNKSKPSVMLGICECEDGGFDDNDFPYLAAVKVDSVDQIPLGMTSKILRPQRYFEASVPNKVSVHEAYASTIQYLQSLSYQLDQYDEIEVYEEMFEDPDCNRFQLLIPIQ